MHKRVSSTHSHWFISCPERKSKSCPRFLWLHLLIPCCAVLCFLIIDCEFLPRRHKHKQNKREIRIQLTASYTVQAAS
jgi:hypothetical protein